MNHRIIFVLLMYVFSQSLYSQIKYIEVNINQPGLTECLVATAIENHESPLNVNIFPNPNEGDFIVEIDHIRTMKNVGIRITNIKGIEVHSEKIKGEANHFKKKLQLSNLSKGVYFVTVEFDKDKCVRRLIIL